MDKTPIEQHHHRPEIHLLPAYEISTETAWTYVPFVTTDGQVGVMLKSNDEDSREEFLYFNPSAEGDAENANVFVYCGGEGHPAHDEPAHFYSMGRDWTD